MKLKNIALVMLSAFALTSTAVYAAEGDAPTESPITTVNGGTVHFKGEVVNAACAIDSESMNQTVELGQVRHECDHQGCRSPAIGRKSIE